MYKRTIQKNRKIILSLLFLTGVFLAYNAYGLEDKEYPKPEIYFFDFNGISKNESNPLRLRHLNIKIDFTRGEGSINFLVDDYTPTNFISIRFPRNITEVEVSKNDDNIEDDIKHDSIWFKNFTENIESNITIQFKSNLQPNSYFQVFSDLKRLILSGNSPALDLIMGDDYECTGRCFIPMYGVKEHHLSSPDHIKIRFDDEPTDNHRFRIEARSRRGLFINNIFLAVGISLSTGSFLKILDIILEKNTEETSKKIIIL